MRATPLVLALVLIACSGSEPTDPKGLRPEQVRGEWVFSSASTYNCYPSPLVLSVTEADRATTAKDYINMFGAWRFESETKTRSLVGGAGTLSGDFKFMLTLQDELRGTMRPDGTATATVQSGSCSMAMTGSRR